MTVPHSSFLMIAQTVVVLNAAGASSSLDLSGIVLVLKSDCQVVRKDGGPVRRGLRAPQKAVRCSSQRGEALRLASATNEPSPPGSHINGVLQNMPELR